MLRCRVCHTPVTGEETYCLHCGSPLNIPGGVIEDVNIENNSLPRKKKRWLLLAGLAALLAVTLGTLALFQPWKPSNYLCMEYHFDTLGTTLYLDGEPLERFDAELDVYSTEARGRMFLNYNNRTAYMADGQSVAIPEEWTMPVLSADGSALAAVAEDGLHHYDLTTGTDTLVDPSYTEERIMTSYVFPCLSPDGSALTYVGEDDALYLWQEGKETRQVAVGDPVALSDGGELLYYADENGRFYVTDGGCGVMLAGKDLGSITFNADNTQVLFCSGDRLFLSRNGGGATAVPVGEPVEQIYPIYPAGTGYGVRSFLGETILLQTIYNNFLVGEIDEHGNFDLLAEDLTGMPQRSSDGSTLVWTTEEGLYCWRQGIFSRPKMVLSGDSLEGMADFFLSADGKHCFFYGQRERRLLDLASGEVTELEASTDGWICSQDYSAVWLVDSGGERVVIEHLAWDGTRTEVLNVPAGNSLQIEFFLDGSAVLVDDTAYYLSPDGGQGREITP